MLRNLKLWDFEKVPRDTATQGGKTIRGICEEIGATPQTITPNPLRVTEEENLPPNTIYFNTQDESYTVPGGLKPRDILELLAFTCDNWEALETARRWHETWEEGLRPTPQETLEFLKRQREAGVCLDPLELKAFPKMPETIVDSRKNRETKTKKEDSKGYP